MEARARQVPFVVVGRDLCAGRLEEVAVANGAVADADRPGSTSSSAGARARGAGDEHLPPARVDDRDRPWCAGGERVERRDAGRRNVEREREPARGGEPDPRAREAPGAGADRERVDVRLRARPPAAAAHRRPRAASRPARRARPAPRRRRRGRSSARSVAVSNARISTCDPFYQRRVGGVEANRPCRRVDVLEPDGRPHRRQPATRRPRATRRRRPRPRSTARGRPTPAAETSLNR